MAYTLLEIAGDMEYTYSSLEFYWRYNMYDYAGENLAKLSELYMSAFKEIVSSANPDSNATIITADIPEPSI